ncbi:MAG: DUF4870 domain-containing protein [Opitutaceae bacterium]|nr:DUF4870 domain-containing protein [Opitutaceae bacterium]
MNTTETTPVVPPQIVSEDKTTAIVSYLTLIGFIVAVVLHGSKKTRLGAFHLRQSLGLMLAAIALGVAAMVLAVIPFVGWLIALCAWLGLFVLWVMGLVAAANGEQKPVPVIGAQFQKWFGTAFD